MCVCVRVCCLMCMCAILEVLSLFSLPLPLFSSSSVLSLLDDEDGITDFTE